MSATSPNSGHTATLRSAQIRLSRTPHIPQNVIRNAVPKGGFCK